MQASRSRRKRNCVLPSKECSFGEHFELLTKHIIPFKDGFMEHQQLMQKEDPVSLEKLTKCFEKGM